MFLLLTLVGSQRIERFLARHRNYIAHGAESVRKPVSSVVISVRLETPHTARLRPYSRLLRASLCNLTRCLRNRLLQPTWMPAESQEGWHREAACSAPEDRPSSSASTGPKLPQKFFRFLPRRWFARASASHRLGPFRPRAPPLPP